MKFVWLIYFFLFLSLVGLSKSAEVKKCLYSSFTTIIKVACLDYQLPDTYVNSKISDLVAINYFKTNGLTYHSNIKNDLFGIINSKCSGICEFKSKQTQVFDKKDDYVIFYDKNTKMFTFKKQNINQLTKTYKNDDCFLCFMSKFE